MEDVNHILLEKIYQNYSFSGMLGWVQEYLAWRQQVESHTTEWLRIVSLYEEITKDEYESRVFRLVPIDIGFFKGYWSQVWSVYC